MAAHINGLYIFLGVGYLLVVIRFLFSARKTWFPHEFHVWLAVILIAPPLWFIAQYTFLYPAGTSEERFEQFKYGQELASRFWAAISAFALAVALKKEPPTGG